MDGVAQETSSACHDQSLRGPPDDTMPQWTISIRLDGILSDWKWVASKLAGAEISHEVEGTEDDM